MNMAAIPKLKYAQAQVTDSKNSLWVAKFHVLIDFL